MTLFLKGKKHAIQEKDFSIEFPNKPEICTEKGLLPETGTSIYFCRDLAGRLYQLSTTTIQEFFGDPEDFLHLAIQEFAKKIHGEITDINKGLFSKKYLAVDYRIDLPEDRRAVGVAILKEHTLYFLTEIRKSQQESKIGEFSNTFEFNDIKGNK